MESVNDRPQTISKRTAGLEKFPGYFTFYWDAKAGKIWLEIDKYGSDFLYVNSITAGLGSTDIGLDRNQLGRTRIVMFQRFGPKILLIQPNYSFRAISDDHDERKAVEDGFVKSVIWGFTIETEEEDRVLIDITSFLLRDARDVVGTIKKRNQGDYTLDLTRSTINILMTKNFPYNTEFNVILTFTSKNPGNFIEQISPHPGSITVRQHHSFIQLPDDDYKPRIFDLRVNFSGMSFMDFATPVDKPIVKRFIARHRLKKKKNPKAKLSDPVEPIVYYVDRGVPEPIRSALIDGASWWNEAFEDIGYKDAFQVKLLPQGVDPMDIRYNVINWVHRSTRGWSYGSGVRDPRTGEIIKGHASIGSLRVRQAFLIAEGLVADYKEGEETSSEMLEMALSRIRQLSCHEVGHTLGLGHNYASNVNDRASVMDYPGPLVEIKENGSLDLSNAYATGIGEWDKVSIAYGYQDFPDGVDEEKELKAILDKAFSRGLLFASSQDARPGTAHPLAATWVTEKNPVDELERVMRIRSIALNNFSEKKIRVGASMATIEEVLVPVYMFHRYQVEAAVSVLRRLYYNHTLRGDVQKNPEIVPASEQRRALDVLLKTIQPESLAMPEQILYLIPPRPPTYGQTRDLFPRHTGLTFDPLAAAETIASLTIGAMMHPERAARLIEYHSRNNEVPSLTEVIDRLISSTWKSSHTTTYYSEIQRVVDNVLLHSLMQLTADEKATVQVRAIAYMKLDELKNWLSQQIESIEDEDQKAHCIYAVSQIKLFQENPDMVKLTVPLQPPIGPPI